MRKGEDVTHLYTSLQMNKRVFPPPQTVKSITHDSLQVQPNIRVSLLTMCVINSLCGIWIHLSTCVTTTTKGKHIQC